MLRPSPLASSAENHLLLSTTTTRLPPPTAEHFSLVLKPQINLQFLSSLSVSYRRCHSPLVCCARSSGRFGVVEIVKEVDGEGQGDGGKAEEEEEVAEISNADGQPGVVSVVGVGNPSLAGRVGLIRMSLGDRAFFLLAFVATTTSIAFTSLVVAAIPTLLALKRTAKSLAKLADTACVELPSTMAAIRLSGLEISDLTVELSDLSQEMADSVNKSTLAVKAAGAGIKQIGAVAHEKTMSLIEERANLPEIPIQPFVAGAARKTSHAVGQAANNLMGYLSGNVASSRKHKPSASSARQGKSSVPPSKTVKPKPSTITES